MTCNSPTTFLNFWVVWLCVRVRVRVPVCYHRLRSALKFHLLFICIYLFICFSLMLKWDLSYHNSLHLNVLTLTCVVFYIKARYQHIRTLSHYRNSPKIRTSPFDYFLKYQKCASGMAKCYLQLRRCHLHYLIWIQRNYFYAHSGKKNMPLIASKIGLHLKERLCSQKLFPLRSAPMVNKQTIIC